MQARRGRISPAGLACAAGGASLWGLSFVVPLFMPGISAWDVSLGRYLVFGTLGTFFVLRAKLAGFTLTRSQWIKAFIFAATGYYGCYTALVFAIDLTGPALPTLVMGLTPVSVAVVANLRTREVPFTRMLPSLGVLAAGLLLVNLARHGQGLAADNLWWGMFASLLAQGSLTYYLVANILFLQQNPHIKPLAWANVTGAVLMAFSVCALRCGSSWRAGSCRGRERKPAPWGMSWEASCWEWAFPGWAGRSGTRPTPCSQPPWPGNASCSGLFPASSTPA